MRSKKYSVDNILYNPIFKKKSREIKGYKIYGLYPGRTGSKYINFLYPIQLVSKFIIPCVRSTKIIEKKIEPNFIKDKGNIFYLKNE